MSKKINELLNSSSKLLESYMKEDICPVCAGEGEVDGEICPECSGEGEIDFPGDNGYYGDDYIEEMFIDDPIENVKNYIEGEFNVENVIQYYLDCADEADIHFSNRQIDLIKKHVMDWFGRKNESLNNESINESHGDEHEFDLGYGNVRHLRDVCITGKVIEGIAISAGYKRAEGYWTKILPDLLDERADAKKYLNNYKKWKNKVYNVLLGGKMNQSEVDKFFELADETARIIAGKISNGNFRKVEALEGKNRLIYDACTPTRDWRPTTAEDVEEDIHVYDYNSAEDLYNDLLEIAEYDDEEVAEEAESDDLFEKINCLLGWFTDPGDGSPNFLYCVVDGKECDEAMPYDCLDDLDLANCSEEDVIEAVKGEFVEDDDYISVEDCIDYCDGNEEAGNILYDWLDNEDNLYGDIADKDIEDLVDAATNPHEKEIVARALGYDWAIDDYDEDDE